jgi:hypothetical protein
MKNQDLKDFKTTVLTELEKIISDSLTAHQRADWSNSEAREIVSKVIVKKFNRYLERK